jgi:hypothetical protein
VNDHHQSARAMLALSRRVAPLLAVPAGLFLVAFLVRSVTSLDRPAQRDGALQITVAQKDGADFEVTGDAPFGSMVEVGTGSLVLSRSFPELGGKFVTTVHLDVWAEQIWARVFPAGSGESSRGETKLTWRSHSVEPVVDVCLYLESTQLLWLAGRATPYERFEIGGLPQTSIEKREVVGADRFGIFDALIPIVDPVLVDVHVRDPLGSRSAPVSCAHATKSDPPPLVRTGTVNQPNVLAVVSSLSGNVSSPSALTEVLKVTLPPVDFSVTVPAAHPYFQAFARGGISATDFLSATFGALDLVISPETIPMLEAQFASLTGGRLAEELAPQSHVRINNGIATVDLRLRASAAEFSGRLSFSASNSGIGGSPFLTEHDVLTIGTDSGWRYDTLPSELNDGRAVWRGPLPVREIVASPPRSSVELSQALERVGNRNTEPTTIRAFLAEFEAARQGTLLSRLWRVALLLIPCASIAWILRGRMLSPSGHRELLGLVVFSASALAWPFVSDQGLILVQFLTVNTFSIFQAVTFDTPSDPVQPQHLIEIASAPAGVLWMVFVTMVGLAPLYSSRLGGPSGLPNPQSDQTRIRTFVGLIPRMLLVVLILGAILWVFRELEFYRVEQFAERLPNDSMWGQMIKLRSGVPGAILLRALLASMLCALPALLFGLRGLLLGVAYLVAAGYIILSGDSSRSTLIGALLALSAVPLVWWLFGVLLTVRRRTRAVVAAGFLLVCVFGTHLSAQTGLTFGAAMLGLGFLWVIAAGLCRTGPAVRIGRWLDEFPIAAAALFLVAGATIGWPMVAPGGTFRASDIAALVDHWNNLLGPVLGVALTLMLWEHAQTRNSQVLVGRTLLAGVILYAVFLVGPTTTWLLLPIPLIVAVVLAGWLFKRESDRSALDAVQTFTDASQVTAYVKQRSLRAGVDTAIASLHGLFQKAKVSPEKYEQRLAAYQLFQEKSSSKTSMAQERLFAIGVNDFPNNVLSFIAIGLLLASVPLAISLYQYLPVSRVDYPFPIAGFVVFVVAATLKWGLFAAFFGLLYPNLRGETGLTKGLCFFIALAVPSAIPYILGAAGLDSVRPFALWLAQLFVFCSLLGLFASDVRLLRTGGRDIRDLKAVHRMPLLSALASSIAAAVVPTILSVAAGQADEVVKVFIQLVSPSGSVMP